MPCLGAACTRVMGIGTRSTTIRRSCRSGWLTGSGSSRTPYYLPIGQGYPRPVPSPRSPVMLMAPSLLRGPGPLGLGGTCWSLRSALPLLRPKRARRGLRENSSAVLGVRASLSAWRAAKGHTVPNWGLESLSAAQGSVPSPGLRPGTQSSVPAQSRPRGRDSVPSPGRRAGTQSPVLPVPAQIGLKTAQNGRKPCVKGSGNALSGRFQA